MSLARTVTRYRNEVSPIITLVPLSFIAWTCSSMSTVEETTERMPATLHALSSMSPGSQAATAGNMICSVSFSVMPTVFRAAAMESMILSTSFCV